MPSIEPYSTFRRHWFGFLFLLPIFPLERIYHFRCIGERVRLHSRNPTDPPFEYHLTAFTSFLGDSLFWVFWGGMLAFVVHAFYVRKLSIRWFLAKLLVLPLYFIAFIFWSFHVD